MLINLELKFFRLSVVAVKKHFMLNTLSVFYYPAFKAHGNKYIFSFVVSPASIYFKLYKIRHIFRKME
jgi:hypothetical protein